jgi:hypothetical protein
MQLASQLVNVKGAGKVDLTQNIVDYTMDVQANPQEFSRLKGVNAAQDYRPAQCPGLCAGLQCHGQGQEDRR